MMYFLKKEITEMIRTGKFFLILVVYALFGIMNPLIAKLTPMMMEMMSKSMEETGIQVVDVSVDALTSWQQFFKNIPIALIVIVFVLGAIYTNEYQKGTLVLIVTKGVSRWKIAVAKYLAMILLWTVGYGILFGITYGYTAYYWDNSIATDLFLAVIFYWIFGCMVISLVQLVSTFAKGTGGVLLGTLGGVVIMYFLTLFANIKDYIPIQLTNGYAIVTGAMKASDCVEALIISLVICVVCFGISIPIFNKRMI